MQSAAALAAQAPYHFGDNVNPEIGFEYDCATDGGNCTDGRSKGFHNLFPTNHLLYGYADYLGWRNMQDLNPYVSLQVRTNLRADA